MENNLTQFVSLCKGLDYELYKDQTLMANARIGAEHYGITLDECTPTFIVKVDDRFIAVIIQGTKKLDFKKIKQFLRTKEVRMATPEEVFMITGSLIGSVSLINPALETFIDGGVPFLTYCYGGCGVEQYTLKINSADLLKVTQATVGDFTKSS